MYTYTGDYQKIHESRSNWIPIRETILPDLSPGSSYLITDFVDLPSPAGLLLLRPIIPTDKAVRLSHPSYLICEADSRGDIDELDEQNNLTITRIRDAIYYTGGVKVEDDRPVDVTNVEYENILVEQSKMINDLQNLLLQGDLNEALRIYNSDLFQQVIFKDTQMYKKYLEKEYINIKKFKNLELYRDSFQLRK